MSKDTATTTHEKPKPGSELIREQAQYWRERAAMCLDNTPKTEREYKTKAAALNATADAYDSMLAACEAAIEYDNAIRKTADDGDYELDPLGAVAEGCNLDALYHNWMEKARAALSLAKGE